MAKKSHTKIVVGFPLYDGVTLMDFVGATDIFNSAKGMFTPLWLADKKRPITTSEGMTVVPQYGFKDNFPAIDVLFVPGGRAQQLIDNAMFSSTYQDFIKKTAATAKWTGSVCVGAYILAAAGLLNNCIVTTYWSQLNILALLKNKLNIKIPVGYPRAVIDTRNKRFSGGGVSSSVDLALALVEKLTVKRTAEFTQLFNQYAPNPPVHAGDPSQAAPRLVEAVLFAQEPYTKLYKAAVERLLEEDAEKQQMKRKTPHRRR